MVVVAALLVGGVVGGANPGGVRESLTCTLGNLVLGDSGSCATTAAGPETGTGEGPSTSGGPTYTDPDGSEEDREDTARDARGDRRDRGRGDETQEDSTDEGPPPPEDMLGGPVSGTTVDEPDVTEWEPADTGAGEHNSEGAGIVDRFTDFAAEAAANALAGKWPEASRNLLHFLGDSGEPLEQDVDQMLGDLPEFSDEVDTLRDDLGLTAVERAKAAGADGPVSFSVRTAWRGFGYDESGALEYENQNWFYALGGWQYSMTGQVTVYPPSEPGGPWRYETTTRTHLRDQYNWDGSKSTQIGPFTVTDEQLAELHRKGLAQEFTAYGVSQRVTRRGDVP